MVFCGVLQNLGGMVSIVWVVINDESYRNSPVKCFSSLCFWFGQNQSSRSLSWIMSHVILLVFMVIPTVVRLPLIIRLNHCKQKVIRNWAEWFSTIQIKQSLLTLLFNETVWLMPHSSLPFYPRPTQALNRHLWRKLMFEKAGTCSSYSHFLICFWFFRYFI